MIRRVLATTVTSAIMVVGAIIGLEAVGLLFNAGPPEPTIASIQTREDPEARAEAILNQRQEELDLAQLHRQAEQERQRREAEQQDAARQMQDEGRKLADAHRWAEQYRRRHDAGQHLAALEPQQEVAERNLTQAPSQAEEKLQLPEAETPNLAGTVAEPAIGLLSDKRLAEARPPAKSQPEECAGRCLAEPIDRRVGPRVAYQASARPKSKRANAGHDDNVCPLVGWLHSVMAPPATSSAPRATARRGAT